MATKLTLLALFATSLALAAEPAKNSCPACKANAAAGGKADACCKEVASGPYSKGSLYQLDARFTDDSGRAFSLGSLRGRRVLVDMFFASCGNACPLTVSDMLAVQGKVPAAMRGGTTYVLVSFDDARDTPEALAKYRAQRHLDSQWVLLHGDGESVRELAALLGVKYQRGEDGSYAHSNLLTVLNAEGEVVHQRVGLQGGLDETVAALAGKEGMAAK